jgi:hypothetical protein
MLPYACALTHTLTNTHTHAPGLTRIFALVTHSQYCSEWETNVARNETRKHRLNPTMDLDRFGVCRILGAGAPVSKPTLKLAPESSVCRVYYSLDSVTRLRNVCR